jgi:carbonic anhydrase
MNYGQFAKGFLAVTMISLMTNTFAENKVMSAERQKAKTPQLVLERLKAGNQRFVEGKLKKHDFLEQSNITSTAQYPVVVVLNCMDSRTPPEIIFDQGIGDIFAIRIAGNIQNNDVLGSMEFGTKLSGAKLIAVIGHTRCGAILGACQHAKLGHLTQLLAKIQPAIDQYVKNKTPLDCDNPEVINTIAKNNVLLVIKQIQAESPVINKLVKEGKIGIIGGIQDLSTGKVTFFEDQ